MLASARWRPTVGTWRPYLAAGAGAFAIKGGRYVEDALLREVRGGLSAAVGVHLARGPGIGAEARWLAILDSTGDTLNRNTDIPATYCTGPIRPIAERLLMDPQRGAVAVVGPTRGSFQHGNALFAREMARQLAVAGRDMGTAFMVAQANSMTKYPSYTDLFRSYVLLGDPLLGGPIVTGAAGTNVSLRSGLSRPRPNPFNPFTTLNVTLASRGPVYLRIYDVRGKLVRTLIHGDVLWPGVSRIQWDGRNDAGNLVASGIFFARMDAAGSSWRQKLVLLK